MFGKVNFINVNMSKKWIAFEMDNIETTPSRTIKSKKLNGASKPAVTRRKTLKAPIVSTNDSRKNGPHIDFFNDLEPQSVEDLAVHNKKVLEVEQWLQRYVCSSKNDSAILLLTGPAGCGKTITVKVLCKSIAAELNEWINPVDLDFESYKRQTDQFREFLFESKYASLFSKKTKRVVLIKDVPNILVREPEKFYTILEQYFLNSSGPVIFICTNVASSDINLKDKLFPDEMIHKFPIYNISFNPSSVTLLKCAINRAENLIKSHTNTFKVPEKHIVDSIIASSSGDLRCALNQYYFASLPATSNLPTDISFNESQSKRKRGKPKTVFQVKHMSKDEVLGLFHSIGRVLNPKWQEKSTEQRLNYDINLLVDEFLTYPNVALGFLQENYPKHFTKSQDMCKAADILSFSQKIVEKWNQNYTDNISEGLWIAVLGLMVSNTQKIMTWNPIKGPRKIRKSFRNHEQSIIFNTFKIDSCYLKLLSTRNENSIYSCANNKITFA